MATVDIPQNVTTIGDGAFCGCKKMSSINIPYGVTSIGKGAFGDCISLTSITIPEKVSTIGYGFFYGCTHLSSVTLQNGITSIGEFSFSGCISLKSIVIPGSVKTIAYQAFEYCSSLESVTLSEGINTIGDYAFWKCSSLTSITIPESLKSIGHCIFSESSLSSVYISNLDNWIKMNKEAIPFADFRDELGSIAYHLYLNGEELTDLVIPENIKEIPDYAFQNCKSLKSITFCKNIQEIKYAAFEGCSNVIEITFMGDLPPIKYAQAFDSISTSDCVIYVPRQSLYNYQVNYTRESDGINVSFGEFDNFVGMTCESPEIFFDNSTKKINLTCPTTNSKCYYTITVDDLQSCDNDSTNQSLSGIYTITAYASAEGMSDSEIVTKKLCLMDIDVENVEAINPQASRGVLLSAKDGNITISGAIKGEDIAIYDDSGAFVQSFKAQGSETTSPGLALGKEYIVKIGNTSIDITL